MTDVNALLDLLKTMGDIDNPICSNCDYEHQCSIEGCTLLLDTIATMEQLYKDVAGSCETCVYSDMQIDQEPCKSCFYGPDTDCGNWQWKGVRMEEKGNG